MGCLGLRVRFNGYVCSLVELKFSFLGMLVGCRGVRARLWLRAWVKRLCVGQ